MRLAAASLTAACLAFASHAPAATLLDADFDAETPSAALADGSTVDGLTVGSDTGGVVSLVNVGVGDNALQLTKSSDVFLTDGRPFVSAPITGVSTTAAGDNVLAIEFAYTRLPTTPNGVTNPEPLFQFLVNIDSQPNVSAVSTILNLDILGTGVVRYFDGTTGSTASTAVLTGLTLTPGTEYQFRIEIDLSSDTQDTWSLLVSEGATEQLNIAGINTRVDNGTPGIVLFKGGVNGGALNADPFAQIDDISVISSPIPEPGSIGLVAAAGALMLTTRRR